MSTLQLKSSIVIVKHIVKHINLHSKLQLQFALLNQ